ncbi:CRISPR-associated protein Csx16 [Thalassospira povalilytica]|uniref:CRISPR-associated protein Csx16 n=1 Tax=Thalassospira povalilytica TaxID=732237 RepID=UPI003AA9C086
MTTFFVTRHPGAGEWARRRNITARPVSHLDVAQVCAGDTVMGTLPVNLVADINARGARYFHLVLDLPAKLRGRELGIDEMAAYNARLEEYTVIRRSDHV